MNYLAFLLGSSLLAQLPQAASVDNPEVRAKFERRRQTPQVVPARPARTIVEGSRTTHVWTLEAVIDRGLLVSFELTPRSTELLEAAGAQHAGSVEDVGHHTIWGGKYFRLLPIVSSTLDDESLQKYIGRPMEFDVAIRSDGRQVVLDVRRP